MKAPFKHLAHKLGQKFHQNLEVLALEGIWWHSWLLCEWKQRSFKVIHFKGFTGQPHGCGDRRRKWLRRKLKRLLDSWSAALFLWLQLSPANPASGTSNMDVALLMGMVVHRLHTRFSWQFAPPPSPNPTLILLSKVLFTYGQLKFEHIKWKFQKQ